MPSFARMSKRTVNRLIFECTQQTFLGDRDWQEAQTKRLRFLERVRERLGGEDASEAVADAVVEDVR